MKPVRLFVSILIVLLLSALAHAQDKADEFVLAQMRSQNIPGLSIAIVRNGEIIKAQGYGVANRQSRTVATPETVYKIASVSKQFIASGIMLLVQDGRISLDDPIGQYVEATPPDWSRITIRHLITHTSGLIREAPGFDPMKVQSDAEVIRTAYSVPLRFAPGERYEYGNVNYFALAEVIRKVSGQPWTAYLNEKIFQPLGMTSTLPTDTGQDILNRASGYSDNDELRPAAEWRALRPSGAFFSTVLDLAKWDAALNKESILTETTRNQMWSPATLNDGSLSYYGFGWQLGRGKRKAVYHTGGMPGFNSAFARYPDDELTVIVLMNLDDVDMDTIFTGLAELYLPDR